MDSRTRNQIFDLMIELKRPVRIDQYLDHVMHYLEMIKSESPEQVEKIISMKKFRGTVLQ
jgi:hypothetical protein